MVSPHPEVTLCFTLNLPVEGIPAERYAAIFQTVIRNQQGFLRYLLLNLQDFTRPPFASLLEPASEGSSFNPWRQRVGEDMPLLEELVRAFCRHRDKLNHIDTLIRYFKKTETVEPLIPPEFLELWHIFIEAMEK